ncbi:nucleotide-binding alpha-beta plait domain-containing protein [Tanacetum coccineum]
MGERSKEDEVHKISTSLFVTNFPHQFNAKDLWNTCKNYGTMVDAYIPNTRSKAGKRFGFVRFIKIFDTERLVNNLCTSLNTEMESKPALVLDSTCVNQRDYSNFLMSKVKDIASLTNLKVVLGKEGFENIELKYMGGYWIMLEFQSKEAKQMFQSSVGIGTWFSQLQQASTDFIIDVRVTWVDIKGIPLKMWSENTFKRKVFWVRAKEISRWVPDFMKENEEETDREDEINSEEFISNDMKLKKCENWDEDSDIEVVPDSKFVEEIPKTKDEDASNSLKFPPGFTPNDTKEATIEYPNKSNESKRMSGEDFHSIQEEESNSGKKKYRAKGKAKEDVAESMCSSHFQKARMPRECSSSMNFLSLNVQGLAQKAKKDWVKELCVKNKCLSDEPLAVPLDEIHIDDKLRFVEEPVEIMDREVKRLKRSRIPIIKVRWNSSRGPEFTWEHEDQFRKKYPQLFTKTAPSTSVAS